MYEPRAVTRVTNPEDVSHHGLVEAVSGSASRIAQLSVPVFAELNPPCRTSPFPGRAVTFMLIEFATCVRSPKLDALVSKLSLSRVAATAVTLYNPSMKIGRASCRGRV